MASSINADNGVVSGSSGLKSTADTSGVLALQSNGTTALTINTDLSATFAGAVTASSFSGTTTTATNLAGGSNGTIPYQSASGTTQMLAAGTSGQVLTSNGAAAPTWATPAPGAGTVTAVASGALSSGQVVIVNSDGTVSVGGQTAGSTVSLGGATVIESSGTASTVCATYDSANNRVVVVYTPASVGYRGVAVVGTISGTSISFGSPVAFTYSSFITYVCCTYDSTNQAIVIAYQDSSPTYGRCVVGLVSGTTISFGSAVSFSAASARPFGIAFNPSSNSVLIVFQNASSSYAQCIAGQVSGTSISFGSAADLSPTGNAQDALTVCYDSVNQKMVTFYTLDNGGGGYILWARVATLTGTSISLGAATNIDSNGGQYMSCAYDPVSQRAVVFYKLIGYNYLSSRVCTVSGTTVSAGSRVDVSTNATTYTAAVADAAAGKVIVTFQQSSGGMRCAVGTPSGTSISFGTIGTVDSDGANGVALAYNSTAKRLVFAYPDNGNSQYMTDKLGTIYSSNVTATNFIGFSSSNYTNGQTATVNTVGSSDSNQTGLTAGQGYYVQSNGTLATTADSPSVYAGVALSATKILVKG